MRPLQLLRRLFHIAARRRTSSHLISQPIPQVTAHDVERVVHRDFAAGEYGMVTAMLSEYGTEKWHREPVRVRLAALKVANGSVQKLRSCIDSTKRDYRDASLMVCFDQYTGMRLNN